MKIVLSLTTVLALSGVGAAFAGNTVELNGITSLFGDTMAFLVLRQTVPHSAPVNFALSQGESRFGIKLLAVNTTSHTVDIEQDGTKLRLRLSSTFDATVPVTWKPDSGHYSLPRPLTASEQSQINRFLTEDRNAQTIQSGAPIINSPYVAGASSATAKSDATPGNPSNSTSTGGSSTDSAAPNTGVANGNGGAPSDVSNSTSGISKAEDPTTEYWYKTSLAIEQNRLATAAEVINGDMEPLPRTPLTPAQTPASLVGPVTYFSNHIPGFVCGGSVDN